MACAGQACAFSCASPSACTERTVNTGWIANTPSSAAFCVTQSIRCRCGTALKRVIASGDSGSVSIAS